MKKETGYFLIIMAVVAALMLFFSTQPEAQQKVTKPLVIKDLPKAAEGVRANVVLGWEQPGDQAYLDANLAGWGLYRQVVAGGQFDKIFDIPFSGGPGPYTTSQTFEVTGTAGTIVKQWFKIDAVNKTGARSGFSNEVVAEFQIPFSAISTPISLTITVTILPK